MAGTFFVVAANAWMNNPVGFDVAPDGTLTDVDPIGGMFTPSMPPQVAHMWIAAFMVVGFGIASVYAVGMLRGRRDRYHRLGMLIPLTVGVVFAPIQIGVGDWIANTVAELQPAKLAAMEALYRTRAGAPLSLGGIYYDDELHYALEIPYGLSLLIHHDPSGVVPGLEEIPEPTARRSTSCTWPTTSWSAAARRCWRWRLAFGFAWWRRRRASRPAVPAARSRCPGSPRWRRWSAAGSPRRSAASPGSCTAILRTADAVSPAPGLFAGFYAVVAIYAVLTVVTVYVLRRLAVTHDVPAPHEGGRGPARRRRRAGAGRRVTMTLPEVLLGVMFLGLIAYALFGGADFGAGIWDLLAGGTRRGARQRGPDRALDRAGVGGQPRLADLRAGGALDGVPAGASPRS